MARVAVIAARDRVAEPLVRALREAPHVECCERVLLSPPEMGSLDAAQLGGFDTAPLAGVDAAQLVGFDTVVVALLPSVGFGGRLLEVVCEVHQRGAVRIRSLHGDASRQHFTCVVIVRIVADPGQDREHAGLHPFPDDTARRLGQASLGVVVDDHAGHPDEIPREAA